MNQLAITTKFNMFRIEIKENKVFVNEYKGKIEGGAYRIKQKHRLSSTTFSAHCLFYKTLRAEFAAYICRVTRASCIGPLPVHFFASINFLALSLLPSIFYIYILSITYY